MSEQIIAGFVRRKIALLDEENARSRALLAKLRRGIGKQPGAQPEIWGITLADMPDDWTSRSGKPSRAEYAVHTALTLYALHRQGKDRSMNTDEKNMTFASAAARLIKNDENRFDAVKRRFDAVATALEFTELAYHARGIVNLFNHEDIIMNYPAFAQDLLFFQFPDLADSIRLRWGEDFYRNSNREEDKEE
jgi:CRISPR system Cascade subunit CasB